MCTEISDECIVHRGCLSVSPSKSKHLSRGDKWQLKNEAMLVDSIAFLTEINENKKSKNRKAKNTLKKIRETLTKEVMRSCHYHLLTWNDDADRQKGAYPGVYSISSYPDCKIQASSNFVGIRNVLMLVRPEKTYFFSAQTEQEQQGWEAHLKQCNGEQRISKRYNVHDTISLDSYFYQDFSNVTQRDVENKEDPELRSTTDPADASKVPCNVHTNRFAEHKYENVEIPCVVKRFDSGIEVDRCSKRSSLPSSKRSSKRWSMRSTISATTTPLPTTQEATTRGSFDIGDISGTMHLVDPALPLALRRLSHMSFNSGGGNSSLSDSSGELTICGGSHQELTLIGPSSILATCSIKKKPAAAAASSSSSSTSTPIVIRQKPSKQRRTASAIYKPSSSPPHTPSMQPIIVAKINSDQHVQRIIQAETTDDNDGYVSCGIVYGDIAEGASDQSESEAVVANNVRDDDVNKNNVALQQSAEEKNMNESICEVSLSFTENIYDQIDDLKETISRKSTFDGAVNDLSSNTTDGPVIEDEKYDHLTRMQEHRKSRGITLFETFQKSLQSSSPPSAIKNKRRGSASESHVESEQITRDVQQEYRHHSMENIGRRNQSFSGFEDKWKSGVLNLTDLSANSKSRTMSLSNLEEICARATPDLLNQLLGNIKLMQTELSGLRSKIQTPPEDSVDATTADQKSTATETETPCDQDVQKGASTSQPQSTAYPAGPTESRTLRFKLIGTQGEDEQIVELELPKTKGMLYINF